MAAGQQPVQEELRGVLPEEMVHPLLRRRDVRYLKVVPKMPEDQLAQQEARLTDQ